MLCWLRLVLVLIEFISGNLGRFKKSSTRLRASFNLPRRGIESRIVGKKGWFAGRVVEASNQQGLSCWTLWRVTGQTHIVPHAHRTLHRAHCTLHRAHCTLHRAQCTLHRAQCTLHRANPHCTLHRAHSTGHIVHCTCSWSHLTPYGAVVLLVIVK